MCDHLGGYQHFLLKKMEIASLNLNITQGQENGPHGLLKKALSPGSTLANLVNIFNPIFPSRQITVKTHLFIIRRSSFGMDIFWISHGDFRHR